MSSMCEPIYQACSHGHAPDFYGTILVNLETHKIVDLLADREGESVQKWLEAHPEVEIVSRDRGGTYVDGAPQGAPLATQVCDRWHILVRRIGAC